MDLNPDFADVHYRLGLLYGEQERFAEAAASFQRSLTVNGANPEVRANLATCLESMGLLDRASAEWEKLADPQSSGLSPDSPFVLRARRRLTRLPRPPSGQRD